MKSFIILIFLLSTLSGCVTVDSPIPDDYTGRTAYISSSELVHGSTKADLFYLYKVNGKDIHNTGWATAGASYGQGFMLTTSLITTEVTTEDQVFSIKGRTTFAAPIQSLASTVYEVKGDISFAPEADIEYVVKGELGENYSSIWVERVSDSVIMDKKIEVNGPSKLNFFQK